MRPLRLVFCLLCFFLDVHVRAEVVSAGSHKYELKSPRVVIARGGLAELRPNRVLHLVRGDFYIDGEGRFSTAFATFSCEGECRALVERHSDHVVWKNLKGGWEVERKGEKQSYAIPPAMQVQVGEVSSEGRAELDFPQSLPWLSTVKLWSKLFPGRLDQFKAELSEFRPIWQEAVEAASDLHERTASREIASANKLEAEEQARRLARQTEDAKLREEFRRKTMLGE